IKQVHAKYDYLAGDDLKAFEQRALELKGLPSLNVEKLYVITEDDQLRSGEMVLFIGLRANCVATVFGLPSRLYRELSGKPENSYPWPKRNSSAIARNSFPMSRIFGANRI